MKHHSHIIQRCTSGINDKQVDNAKDLEAVTPMYNSIEYSKNYSKTSGSFSTITDSETFEFKAKMTEINLATGNAKDFGIAVPLKYCINF